MTRATWVCCLIVLFCMTSPVKSSGGLECDRKFDRNGNQVVEVGFELNLCILHSTSAIHRQFDKNLNGRIDWPMETESIERAARIAVEFVAARYDAEEILQGSRGLPVSATRASENEEISAEITEKKPAPRLKVENGFLVRAAYEAAGVLNQPKTDLSKVAGAQISFTHNIDSNDSVGSASGVFEFFRTWTINTDALKGESELRAGVMEGAVHLGAEFNRKIDSANPTKDVNSLTLRAGGEIGVQGVGTDYHFFRSAVFDATDFDFDAHVVGGEVEWEPVFLPAGIGVAQAVPNLPVYYRWRPVLHAEYQNVVDTGGSAKLAEAPEYLFAGPVLAGELWFGGGLERLSLDAKYWAMWDLLGRADPFQYLEVGANWGLDEAGHFALTAKYRSGNLPKTREPVNDVLLGLTTKF